MIQDLRFAFGSLVRRKALLALAVATLALGVGTSTALFSVVNGVLLRPLPCRAPERLAILWHVFGHDAHDLPAKSPALRPGRLKPYAAKMETAQG